MSAEDEHLMRDLPPVPGGLVTLENWCEWPYLRWGFQHVRELVPTARIDRGEGPVWELERALLDLASVELDGPDGAVISVADALLHTHTDGFLVLHRGRVAAEQYDHGLTASTPHLLQSVSKSVTGALAGILVGRGELIPDAAVSDYVPELARSSFELATVRQVLDMRTGTRYSEDYEHPQSDVQRSAHLAGWGPVPPEPGAPTVYEQLLQLSNDRPHGERFGYRSILTDLLAWMLERASDVRYPELLSAEIWAQLGAEHDAEITIRHGVCQADGGISMTLRDLARFGEMIRMGGIAGGRQIVPAQWIADIREGDLEAREAFARGDRAEARPGWMYRNQWWVEPERGVAWALGVHGQLVCVHLPAQMVVVKLSSWPRPWDDALHELEQRVCAAVAARLAAG